MKLSDVRKLMVKNTVVPSKYVNSLPVAVQVAEKKQMAWFQYRAVKEEKDIYLSAEKLFLTEDGQSASCEDIDIRSKLEYNSSIEPKIDENTYYERLEELFEDFTEEDMEELLKLGVGVPWIELYLTVLEYLCNMNPEMLDEILDEMNENAAYIAERSRKQPKGE